MPPRFPGGKPRLSTWRLTEAAAAERGLTERDPNSLQVHRVDDDPARGRDSRLAGGRARCDAH